MTTKSGMVKRQVAKKSGAAKRQGGAPKGSADHREKRLVIAGQILASLASVTSATSDATVEARRAWDLAGLLVHIYETEVGS